MTSWNNPLLQRQSRRRMLLLTGGAALLAACGGENDRGSGSGGAATSPAGTPLTGATRTPKQGGRFTWSDRGNTPLDPTNNPTYRAQTLAGFTYSRLLKFRTGPTPETAFNYEIEPDLAASWEVLDGGTRVIFKLRSGTTFHNKPPVNGRAVEAEDVRASFERFRTAPKNTNKYAFGSPTAPLVESLEVPDASTVVVRLAKPYAPILNLFANPQYFWIQPKEIGTEFDPSVEQIGSGPWMLDSVEPDIAIRVRRNPSYFLKDRPYIDEVRRVVLPDIAQAIAQFQAGQLDLFSVPAQSQEDVRRTNPQAAVTTYIPTTYTFISPQQRGDTPFKDVRVRRAISRAIDRAGWGDLLYEGQGVKVLSAVPVSMGKWWLDPTSSAAGNARQWFQFDVGEARKLLQAAGAENLQLRFLFANNAYGEVFNQGAEVTGQMLKQAGFDTQIVAQDYLREYIDADGTFFGRYDGAFYGLQTPFTDPHDYLFNMNHPRSARNHAGIDDPRLTQMIDAAERTLDDNERVKRVHEIQRYWLDQLYYIPVAVGNSYQFQQPWVKRLYYSATYGWAAESLVNAWIDRG